tara:strand:- start:95 stop:658 length:564 start_codon:yes stop_codon:yes gene_type:complete
MISIKDDRKYLILKDIRNYISLGFKVLLLHPGEKRPLYDKELQPNGFYNATDDYNKLEKLVNKYPNSNIGIRTGKESNISVFDFDDYDNNLDDLLKKGLRPGNSLKWKTPHGVHIILQYNSRIPTRTNFLPRLDIKNDGGYVVAPPSEVKCDGSKHHDNKPCNQAFYEQEYDFLEFPPITKFEDWKL